MGPWQLPSSARGKGRRLAGRLSSSSEKRYHHLPCYQRLEPGGHPCPHHAPHCPYTACQQTPFTPVWSPAHLSFPCPLPPPGQGAVFTHLIYPHRVIPLHVGIFNETWIPVPYLPASQPRVITLSLATILWPVDSFLCPWCRAQTHAAPCTCNTTASGFSWGELSPSSGLSSQVSRLPPSLKLTTVSPLFGDCSHALQSVPSCPHYSWSVGSMGAENLSVIPVPMTPEVLSRHLWTKLMNLYKRAKWNIMLVTYINNQYVPLSSFP